MSTTPDAPQTDVPAPMPSRPRWELTVTPNGSEANMSLTVHAPGVTASEVTVVVAKLTAMLAGWGGRVLPTEDELKEYKRLERLAASHPAKVIFVREDKHVWIADSPKLSDALRQAGWVYGGDVPEEIKRPCELALLGEEGFAAVYLEKAVSEST